MPTFTIETSQFQGHLKKPLNQIEARKMLVSDVSLAEVTDAYLTFVEKLPELPRDMTRIDTRLAI
ncbi:MAG: hypothetical protein AAB947_01830 [Patescibacteria group bacterium]